MDTMAALKREANINDKDYRMWFKLNVNAVIGVSTSVGNLGVKSSEEQRRPRDVRGGPEILS